MKMMNKDYYKTNNKDISLRVYKFIFKYKKY